MATAAERQKAFRESQKQKGLVPVTVYVPVSEMGDIQIVARMLCENRDLVMGPCRDVKTGRLVSIS